VHVVEEMKRTGAVIGGEGNGGVIYPALHYGRDALVGIALVLSYLARSNRSLSEIRSGYPDYTIIKERLELPETTHAKALLDLYAAALADRQPDTRDGVKIFTDDGWVHLRASNTEPILRIYAESKTEEGASKMIGDVRSRLLEFLHR
jgi:phosphomannomutase